MLSTLLVLGLGACGGAKSQAPNSRLTESQVLALGYALQCRQGFEVVSEAAFNGDGTWSLASQCLQEADGSVWLGGIMSWTVLDANGGMTGGSGSAIIDPPTDCTTIRHIECFELSGQ